MSINLFNEFRQGNIINPNDAAPKFTDMVHAISFLTGASEKAQDISTHKLIDLIGPADHIVFVLVDGLGMKLVQSLPENSFLRSNVSTTMHSVFPSTTACALTTLATGEWPGQHGVPGWWTYLKEYDLSIISLPFVERVSRSPIENLKADVLWPLKPILPNMKFEPFTISSNFIWDSEFSRYARGGCSGIGYSSISNGVNIAIERIKHASAATYTYIYFSELDEACHNFGVNSTHVSDLLYLINNELQCLAEAIQGKARLIISADHGQIDIPFKNRFAIYKDDKLLDYLYSPPSGDSRVHSFHVIENKEKEFMKAFNERFGEYIALLSRNEADSLRLFSPYPMSQLFKQRIGDFIGISVRNTTFKYYDNGKNPSNDKIGYHSGLSPDEMQIPLILY